MRKLFFLLLFVSNLTVAQVSVVATTTNNASTPLPFNLQAKFSFLSVNMDTGDDIISDNDLTITNKDYTGTIPYTSTATLQMANVAGLKTDDDFDAALYTDAGTPRTLTAANLLDNDYTRTLVKYSGTSPFGIEWIGLLQKDVSISESEWNQLYVYFDLSVFWNGTFNENGEYKDNRALEGQGYKGWIAYIDELELTHPSVTVKGSLNKMFLEINRNDKTIWAKMDALWVFMLNDISLVNTTACISMVRPSINAFSFPVAPTYTLSGFEGNASSQYGNSNFNATTDAINYTINSACRIIYKYKAGVGNSGLDGHPSFTGTNFMQNNSTAANRINQNGNSVSANFGGIGYRAIDRAAASGAGAVSSYVGTTKTDGTGVADASLTNEKFSVLRNSNGYSDAGAAIYAISGHYIQAQHGILNTAMTNHKTRLGL